LRRTFLTGLVWLSTLAGCNEIGLPSVACVSTPGPAGLEDTLYVRLLLGVAPPEDQADVLVRVDPLNARGAVSFSAPPPPNAGAVSLAVTSDATFQGCLNPSPGGFRIHAREAPLGKLWIRVSSNRPVVIHPPRLAAHGPAPTRDIRRGAGAGAQSSEPPEGLTVLPRASARARWNVATGLMGPR
jgi:hypothetical protein